MHEEIVNSPAFVSALMLLISMAAGYGIGFMRLYQFIDTEKMYEAMRRKDRDILFLIMSWFLAISITYVGLRLIRYWS